MYLFFVDVHVYLYISLHSQIGDVFLVNLRGLYRQIMQYGLILAWGFCVGKLLYNGSHKNAMRILGILAMDALLRLFDLYDEDAGRRAEAIAALKEGFGLLIPTIPAMIVWAIVTAVAMIAAGLSPFYVLLINLLVYAGSAQLAVLSMLVLGAHLPLIWLTAFVVNLRFVVFSGTTKPFFRGLPLRFRLLYGFLTGDVPLMVFLNHFKHTPSDAVQGADVRQKGVFIGLGLANWVAWQAGVVVGIALASMIPNDWGLSLVAALTLLVLIVKMVDSWPALAGCIAAALTAIFLHDLPNKLWVFCAIVVGVLVAMLAETIGPKFWPSNWPKRVHNKEVVEDT